MAYAPFQILTVLNFGLFSRYNGQLPLQNRGRYKTYFKLEQRSMANGLVAVDHFALNSEQAKAVRNFLLLLLPISYCVLLFHLSGIQRNLRSVGSYSNRFMGRTWNRAYKLPFLQFIFFFISLKSS